MSGRARLTLCAYAATLMAAGALIPLVQPSSWIVTAAVLLGVTSGVGALTRRVPLARPLTIGAQALAGLLALTLVFVREHALLGFLPGPRAFVAFAGLFEAGAADVSRYASPAPATDGIQLMLVGGVLVIGLVVDALAVTFRLAAPAGLPLLALYSVAAGLSGGSASWAWFLLAAGGYLLLLLAEGRDRLSQWGRVFGGVPRSAGRAAALESGGTASSPVRTGRRIGVVAMGLALAVPTVLPAMGGGMFGGPGPGNGPGGGRGGTISAVNPLVSLQDNLNQPEDREVLSYRTNATETSDLYLRLVALDQFDGTSWKSSKRSVQDVPERLPAPQGLGAGIARTEVTGNFVASASYDQKWLPMPYPATRVEIGGRWRYEPAGRMLVGDDEQSTRGVRYSVSSLRVEPTARQLANAPAPPEDLRREYTKVPESLPAEVAATARQVTQKADNAYERAVALQEWFTRAGGFRYDTTVASGTGAQAITRFLKQKEGFCVHFSFSMAAMARTLGIPARVAVGFMPGTQQLDGRVSVGIRDAHAWPELYFEGVGWTRFEPTPQRGTVPPYTRGETPSSPSNGPSAPAASESAAAPAPTKSSAGCSPQLQRQGECGRPEQTQQAADEGLPGWLLALWIVLGVLVLLLLLALPLLWRTRVRSGRLAAGPSGLVASTPESGAAAGGGPAAGPVTSVAPEDAAPRTLAAWRELVDTAWDYGIVPDESLTLRKAAARIVRLGHLQGDPADAVHRVARAVEQVLYAPGPRPVAGLAGEVQQVRAGLAALATRGEHLRALLLPRSSVRVIWAVQERWSRWAGRVEGFGNELSVRRAAMTRRLLRRHS
ncbi:transglutaminase TgpA family protein [Streptomyces tritici]|uniref:transglutaminase TgpA family protein n=1 Tax=Streptomyces tritici TaxID=2054410 RepID=UPI003AF1312E